MKAPSNMLTRGRVNHGRIRGLILRPVRAWSTAVLLLLLPGVARLAHGAPGDTELVSVNALSDTAAGSSSSGSVSADGRYVAFVSTASTLVPGQNSQFSDIFVRDRLTLTNERVSVALSGAQTNGDSSQPSVSADGRFVAFTSKASNLVAGDNNGKSDIFVRDRLTGKTELVSVDYRGVPTKGVSWGPSISADGRYVAFVAEADLVVPEETGNGVDDVFVRDRQTGQTEWVSVALNYIPNTSGGGESASISADGRYVAFYSPFRLLGEQKGTGIFVRDRQAGQTEWVSVPLSGLGANGSHGLPVISANGRYVAYSSTASNLVPGDSNGTRDIFVRDRQTGQTERVSVASNGAQANDQSEQPSISADGRYVAFWSDATNLVADDTNGYRDVIVRDREKGDTQRASVASNGLQGDSRSDAPAMSADGRYVAFSSYATNLVPNDPDIGAPDVFIHELGGSGTMGYTFTPRVRDFGEQVLFTSSTRTFTLSNTGSVALPIVSVEIVGANRAAFTFSNRCGNSVAVGVRCAINVRFRPTSVGAKLATLQVVAGNKPVRKRNLTGTGIQAP